ncbi:AEC family transporter [Arthrobacter sp. JZ12]|nr:AEC family transporter [Arthrobacter sp. JZ12]
MDGVLKGFFVVGAVMLVGYILGRSNALGPNGTKVLSTLSFMVGLPSLMFSLLVTTSVSETLSTTGLIAALTATACMLVYAVVGAICGWGREAIIGALTTGIVNSTNLGVPLSLYILGSATYVVPIMLFQLALITPIALTLLDLTETGRRNLSIRGIVATPFRNPVTVAALLGVCLSALNVQVPDLILAPISLLAEVTVPLMLIIFGMSLNGLRIRAQRKEWAPTTLAVLLKSAFQPALAWILAAFVFGLSEFETFVVTACAILPTGQNVVLYAIRYRLAERVAQTTAVMTTVLAIPLLVGAALVMG